ncbi:ATP-binding protein [Paraburkholderia sp.]|uniref:ATP-binding protein n=1 Tax=Paraburkholderia sp. TaxID=1926495 RepID=UPI003D6EFAE3
MKRDERREIEDAAWRASAAPDDPLDPLAVAAHELRTPMSGVFGLLDVLARTPLDTEQRAMVHTMSDTVDALLATIDTMLDRAKHEAVHAVATASSSNTPFGPRELIDGVLGVLSDLAHRKGLRVGVDIEPDVAARLTGDGMRLRQLLFNLVGNAIRFTEAGSIDVHVSVDNDDAYRQTVAIAIRDTGIGIAPHRQVQVFRPFVQAETLTARRSGGTGTGLGLAICRELAARIGATLDLRSEPSIGTCVTLGVTMPIDTLRHPHDELHGRRALIAIDDPATAAALTHFAQARGLDVTCVPRGASCAHAPTDTDLCFIDEADTALSYGESRRVVRVTRQPTPAGYRIVDGTLRLGTNPLSWRAFGDACAAALRIEQPPASIPTQQPSSLPSRDRAVADGLLVLVADDHPVNRMLIRHRLAALGLACDVVSGGIEALAALDRTRYGCLISDCQMPGLSGYELAKRVRERSAAGDIQWIPILGITASLDRGVLRACREAGMDDCIVKPVGVESLRASLSRWFDLGGDNVARRPAMHALDLTRMKQSWGNESIVKTLLEAFVVAVRDDIRALRPLLDHPDAQRLLAWHHRVAGAASVLQHAPLLAALDAYRRDIATKPAERLRVDGFALAGQCDVMLDGIERQVAQLAE